VARVHARMSQPNARTMSRDRTRQPVGPRVLVVPMRPCQNVGMSQRWEWEEYIGTSRVPTTASIMTL
jgi:hypothetical protein